MVEHFGSGTLVDSLPTTRRQGKFCLGHEGKFEPASLTIRLHALSEPQHQEVVDYIDYCHKALKEQFAPFPPNPRYFGTPLNFIVNTFLNPFHPRKYPTVAPDLNG